MSKVRRRVLHDGGAYLIECAIAADGVSSPADQILRELEENFWDDPASDKRPDEAQTKIYTRVMAHFEWLAEYGRFERPTDFNSLDQGIWEIKVANVRFSFFDTDGVGGYSPKYGTAYLDWQQKLRWELPEQFDEFVRIGHCFAKVSQQTLEEDLQQADAMREEDVGHDR